MSSKPFGISLPAVSKHLKVLEGAGLISRTREAQRRPCKLEADRLEAAMGWLHGFSRYWGGSFDRVEEHLREIQGPGDE